MKKLTVRNYLPAFVLLFLSILCLPSCHKNNNPVTYACNAVGTPTDTLINLQGMLLFDDRYNVYEIRYVPEGTIDNVNLYILCDAPAKLPPAGTNVTCSGYVRPASMKPELAGTQYYELELTSLR